MAQPILTLSDSNNSTLPLFNMGVVDAGNQTLGFSVRIWNNQAGANNISDAINPTITTKTYNGYDSGDSVQDGEELVVNQYIQVQNISAGQTSYSAIGGPNVLSISDSAPQPGNSPPPPVIHSNSFAACLIRCAVPASATAGNISFLFRVAYQYQ